MTTSKCILLGNIPEDTDEQEITDLLSPHGIIESTLSFGLRFQDEVANIMLVAFVEEEEAKAAADVLNGSEFNGHRLACFILAGGSTKLPWGGKAR